MATGWEWLPAAGLWVFPVADSRSALSTVTVRFGEVVLVDATLAADFPLVAWRREGLALQFGIEAGGFMGFDPGGELTFGLDTFDGLFAFPLTLQSGEWTGRVEWAHLSAHFADGVRDNGGLPGSAEGFSREWVRLQGARTVGPARFYAGAKVLTHDTRSSPPLSFSLGGEVAAPWRVAPLAAVDLQVAQESEWSLAFGGFAGVALQTREGRRLRVGLAGRTGPEDTGKLSGQREQWLGLQFGFDATGAVPDLAP